MNIAIFGGSFDPIHTGHIEIIKSSLERLDIDKLIVVPTFLNPFKKSFLATPKVRFGWIKEVFKKELAVEVNDFEIKQNTPTPTIKTVEYFEKKLQAKKIYLIIGADNIPTLHLWQEYDRLSQKVKFVVASREGFEVPKDYIKLNIDIDISSSNLRESTNRRFLPKNIAKDIIHHYQKS